MVERTRKNFPIVIVIITMVIIGITTIIIALYTIIDMYRDEQKIESPNFYQAKYISYYEENKR